ncbi:hypothetical protein GPECTOR_78g68 [Gonium pectorale]|uniref:Uncharacterized protein n=1 Tax=Gonium pectorale TaxID=33097 RepID=A0A150G3J4_GONPE|nr:hypothetical protein GPECTOR_78g68 [Gonium pectorale]|eukprot:KXZ43880.1 hypothetical protein GPECTOR_78g68 [Gonium pectorale]
MAAVQHVATSYEVVHTATGLPWAASIPLTTLALRLALLPLSMRQARIIRTNYALYKEALALTDRQEEEQKERGREQQGAQSTHGTQGRGVGLQQRLEVADLAGGSAAGGSGASTSASASAAAATGAIAVGSTPEAGAGAEAEGARSLQARLLRSQAVLANFHMLRRKCDAPHPVWIVVNPLVQIPVFVLVSATLGMMCRAPWPGLSSEGALWFPDLTQPAVLMATGQLPLGPAGLALPLIVYGMTMASLRLGFGASGLAGQQQQGLAAPGAPGSSGVAGTALGAFLRSLPPLLYTMTTLNLYFKVQMAHGVLVHWFGSASFTLSLQMALRNPTLRTLLKLNRPAPAAGDSAASGSSSGESNGRLGRWADVPSELVARVEETTDANVLVIMGAQLSARHQYAGALHCLRKAVLLNPSHVRAHYSMGQVYSLTGGWPDAELSYRAAAELAPAGPERGQALYCVATALHAQSKLTEAIEAYGQADEHWRGQAVIAYGRANALAAVGRREEALEALAGAEERDRQTPGRPFQQALARLRQSLMEPAGGTEAASAGVANGGKPAEGRDQVGEPSRRD